MNRQRVLIGPGSFGKLNSAPLALLEEAGFELVMNPYGRTLTKDELIELLSGVCGILAGLEPLDEEVLTGSQLKAISRCGSGMSNVDLAAAERLGIAVSSTPDGPVEAVAELTLGALLALLRHVPLMDRSMRSGEWSKKMGVRLQGKTVVIVGFGRIGRRVAELLAPFDVEFLVVDPAIDSDTIEYEVVTLADALPRADIVSLHLSGDGRVLGESEFEMLKPGAYILNSARGGLIDEDALIRALESGRVAGAWLDAYAEEPYEGPLTGFDQVVLTPHVGSYARESREAMEMDAAQNLVSALLGSKRGSD